MQILITHSGVSKTQVLHFNRWQLSAVMLLVVIAIMLFSGAIYSAVFLKAAREGWPIVGPAVRPLVQGEAAQRERFLRDNLDAMARKVGEMQAKLVKLEALGERVSAQAGVKADDLRSQDPPMAPKARARAGQGGPFVPADPAPPAIASVAPTPSFDSLHLAIDTMDHDADHQAESGQGTETQQALRAFWRDTLAGAPALIELPGDRPRPPQQDFVSESIDVRIESSLRARLESVANICRTQFRDCHSHLPMHPKYLRHYL